MLTRLFFFTRSLTVFRFFPFQELISYGAGNIAGSFFSCFPICNALARTAVQENLANTQVIFNGAKGNIEIQGKQKLTGFLRDKSLSDCDKHNKDIY